MTDAPLPEKLLADPFFLKVNNTEWNACLGSQGSEINYIDGFIDAAVTLVGGIIDKKEYGKRDTLVMPILYTARHGVELALKFTINQLVEMNVLPHGHHKNHDLQSHFDLLDSSELGDRTLSEILDRLSPFVAGLARIDDDGQELRYHQDQDGNISLAEQSIANLVVIRASLTEMQKLVNNLTYRITDLRNERITESYTKECSRLDLLAIAERLPQIGDWKTDAFTHAKQAIRDDYGLSSNQFSRAVDVIKGNRAMKALYGELSQLGGMTDEIAIFIMNAWLEREIERRTPSEDGMDWAGAERIDKLFEDLPKAAAFRTKLAKRLSANECADLETLFYFGRDGHYAELYEKDLARNRSKYVREKDPVSTAQHVLTKTNFADCFAAGIRRVGRADLAEQLEQLIADSRG